MENFDRSGGQNTSKNAFASLRKEIWEPDSAYLSRVARMSSWQYAILFPGSSKCLAPSRAVDILCRLGLEFDNEIRQLIAIDQQGHMLDAGEEIRLFPPVVFDLRRRLEKNEQLSIECRNSDIFLSCTFATQA